MSTEATASKIVEVKVETPLNETVPQLSEDSSSTESFKVQQGDTASVLKNTLRSATDLVQELRPFLPILVLTIVGFIGLKLALGLLGAVFSVINGTPLLPSLLEFVGIAYVTWFTNRYLLSAAKRQELSQKLSQIKKDIVGGTGLTVSKSVIVHKPAEELYRFWRNFENLPHFMPHLEAVTVQDDRRSHWVAKAPLGSTVEWDAEIIREVENKTIVWRSLAGAEVESVGSVAFIPNGSSTEVKVTMEYKPPGGEVGAAAAAIFGEAPQQQLNEDLNRFKQLMEAGS